MLSAGQAFEWPDKIFSLSETFHWLNKPMPGRVTHHEIPRVLQAKPWGVTAHFKGANLNAPDVIFKGTQFPLFENATTVAQTLSNICPMAVPQVLASEAGADWRRIAFEYLDGKLLAEQSSIEVLKETTTRLAQIQNQVSIQGINSLKSFTSRPIMDITGYFDHLLFDIENRHMTTYQAENGALASKLELPLDFIEKLKRYKPSIYC